MIGLHQYQCFVAVAEELHFGRAAERLGVAQSAVSRDIRALERFLRNDLFARTTRKVELTDFGRRFLALIQAALTQLDRATKLARLEAQGQAGVLRFGYMNFAMHGPAIRFVYLFKNTYPNVIVELVNSNTDQMVEDLLELRLDAAIIVGQPKAPSLKYITLSNEPLAVILSENHPLAVKKTLAFKDLAGEPVILGRRKNWRGFRQIIEHAFTERGLNLNISQEVRSSDVMFGLVELGDGISLYPDGVRDRLTKGLVLRPLTDNPPSIQTSLAWHSGNKSAPLANFLKFAEPNNRRRRK